MQVIIITNHKTQNTNQNIRFKKVVLYILWYLKNKIKVQGQCPPWITAHQPFVFSGQLTLNKSHLDNYHSDNYLPTDPKPLLTTIEKCFETSCFLPELLISGTSIATGNPSRRDIVNPFLELLSFSSFFISTGLLNHKSKMKFFSASFRTHF